MSGSWAHCGDCGERSQMMPTDTALRLWVETHVCAPPKPKPKRWDSARGMLASTTFRLGLLLSLFHWWSNAEEFWWSVALGVATGISLADVATRIDKPRRRR